MFAYYIRLALISLRKDAVISLLMICAIALGIGACMTFVNVSYVRGLDPIPHKSSELFAVQLDSWSPHRPYSDEGTPPRQLTYLDASALMQARRAHRQAAMTGTSFVVLPEGENARPFDASGRATYADFFAMFDVPFLFGGAWDARMDESAEQVAVLSRQTNERLFGGEDSVGRDVNLNGRNYRVYGVLDEYEPLPKFYDPHTGFTAPPADIFVPFELMASLRLPRRGNTSCWKPAGDGFEAFLASECVWIQFWAELRNDEEKQGYLAFLDNYVNEQKRLGRFERPLNNRLRDVTQWIDDHYEDEGVALLIGVGVMFLFVCLLNMMGLLLAKFFGKAPEIGLRRALGASKRALFAQHMVETGCVGVAGGALGVVTTWLALRGVALLFGEGGEGELPEILTFQGPMVAAAVALAIVSALAAGIYPTWRACNVPAATLVKTQ